MPRTSGRDSGYAAGGDVTKRRREKEALTALRRVATLVAKGVPPQDLFAVVAEEVARVVDVPVVSIVRYEADDTATECASFSSGRPVFVVGRRWSLEGTNVLQQIRETLAPARIDDYSGLEGEIADYVRRAGLSSRVGIPIVVAGRLWGAAVVSSAERLPDGTEARLADFTELLATAIANAESRKTLETLVDEQTALRRLATLVAQEPSQTQIFGAIAEEAMQLLRTDAVRIVRYDGESGVVLAASGQPEVTPPGFRFPLDGETVAARIFRQGKPARQDEYKELSGPVADPVRAAGIRSVVGAPVLAGGRLWGAITTGMTQEEPLPPDTESRLGEFTALMATAISNAEARAEAERLVDEQLALRRVATLVAQAASPSSVLDAVVAEMKALLDADQVALNRFEPDDEIAVLAHRGLDVARTPVGSRVSHKGTNVTSIVRHTGKPARMVDYADAPGPLAEIARATGLRSSVSVPIGVEGRVWGLITASWKRDEPPPPETEERMAKFAHLIDTAIANADARGEVARLLDEQATLRSLATLVAEGAAPDEIFTAVTTEVGRVFGTSTAAVGRFEEKGPAITILGVAEAMAAVVPVGTRWLLDDSMASAGVFHTEGSARVDFDDESSFDSPHFEAARRLGVVSNVASPILVEGRCWGALSVSANEPLPHDAANTLEQFSEIVATAIANAAARGEVERLADEQAALRRVATLVAEGVPSAELFSAVTKEVAHMFSDVDPAVVASVIRFDPGPESVLVGASREYEEEPLGSRWTPKELYVSTHVLRRQRSARVGEADLDAVGGPDAEVLRLRRFLYQVGSPVVVEGQLWGAMCLNSKEELPPDTEERLEKFTELVGTAIGNTLSQEARALLTEEQAALRRVATLVARGIGPEGVFRAVADEVGALFGSDIGAIVRFEDDGTATVLGNVGGPHSAGKSVTLDPGYVVHTVRETGRSARFDTDDPSAASPGSLVQSVRVRSAVASPIVVAGELWGAVTAGSLDVPLVPGAERRLTEFTELVATAVANTEAREEVTLLADEQAALRRVAELVALEASPMEVFHAVTAEAARVVHAEAVGLLRFEPEGTATLVAQSETPWDPPPLGTQFALDGENPVVEVARTGQAARMDDWTSASGSVAAMATVLGVRSAVATPIVVEGRRWGTMVAASSAADPLPGETESRIRQFTALVATAIANADARAEVERLAEEQAALRRVATLVAEGVQPTEVFSAVSREVERVFAMDQATDLATVVRFDPGPEFVLVGAAKTFEGLSIGSRWEPKGLYVSTRVFRTGRSARVEQSDLLSVGGPDAEMLRRKGLNSQVGSPIVVDGRLWGAITMNAKETLPPDTEDRLAKFTELIATAIANADSREALAGLADEQTSLRRVATLVARGTPPEDIFDAVAEEIGRLLPTANVSMGRYEPDGDVTSMASWSSAGPVFTPGVRWQIKGTNVAWMVLQTGRPARIDDFSGATDPIGVAVREAGFKSAIGSPIVVEGHLWGVISAASTEGPMPPGSEARLASFTELVGTAVANADSREALAGLVKEQTALRRVATLVAEGVPPSAIFAAVSREVAGVVGARMDTSVKATVIRFDPRQECVLVGASKAIEGMPLGMRWQPHDLFVSSRVLRTGRPARVEESEVLSAKGRDAEKLRRQGYLSQVGTPIVVESRLWGAMTLSATETLPADTEERLVRFTELVATAIANAENKSELAASRRRIVAASDDARRRIERDLHDGVQQRLVSLGLAVRAAEADVPPDRKDLREELSRVATGLSDTLEGLQELSRGIHPAILSQGGLAPALRMLGRRSTVPVELNLTTSERFREPVEVAAYFVASEALTNAAKHSQASRVHISLATREKTLELSIRDDGVGGADPTRGSGLVGLVDRVEAIGGSIRVRSYADQGTHISAELPLEADPVEESERSALPLAAIASAAEALYVVDAQGRIRFLNPAALHILGYDDEEQLLGRSSHETIHYMHPDGTAFPAAECPLLLPRVTGEAVHVDEDWFVRQDRTFVRVAYSSAAIPLPGGRGAVVSFRDLPPKGADG
jgi:PAS domain S-box-containing protein